MGATHRQLEMFSNVGTEMTLHVLAHDLEQMVDIHPLIAAMRAA